MKNQLSAFEILFFFPSADFPLVFYLCWDIIIISKMSLRDEPKRGNRSRRHGRTRNALCGRARAPNLVGRSTSGITHASQSEREADPFLVRTAETMAGIVCPPLAGDVTDRCPPSLA